MPGLQKYGGRSTRYTCPNCKRDHCFIRYLDDNGEEIDPTCGICDQSGSCGYHLPPREFYKLHPEKKPAPDWRYQKVDWAALRATKPHDLPVATCFIPPDIVLRSVKPERNSDLVDFLHSILAPLVVEDLVRDYQLGVTRDKDVIFFQLDINGSCRTGKIMKYNPETGHRWQVPDHRPAARAEWPQDCGLPGHRRL